MQGLWSPVQTVSRSKGWLAWSCATTQGREHLCPQQGADASVVMCRYEIGFCMVSLRNHGIYVISLGYAVTLGLGKVRSANSQRKNFGIGSTERLPYSVSPWTPKIMPALARGEKTWNLCCTSSYDIAISLGKVRRANSQRQNFGIGFT